MRKIKKVFCFVLLLALFATNFPFDVSEAYAATAPKIKTFYVNHGTCSIIEFNGKYILIDAGDAGKVDNVINYINDIKAKNDGYFEFEYVIITHYDPDHVEGLEEILSAADYNVNNYVGRKYSSTTLKLLSENSSYKYIYNNFATFINCVAETMGSSLSFSGADSYTTLVSKWNKLNTSSDYNWLTEYDGTSFTVSGTGSTKLKFNFYNKSTTFITQSNLDKNLVKTKFSNLVNDDSLVFRADYYSSSSNIAYKALFTGDTHYLSEKYLIENHKSDLRADLLMVPHHGILSNYTGDAWVSEFFDAVFPDLAIIPNGAETSTDTLADVIQALKGVGVSASNIVQIKNESPYYTVIMQ